MCGDPLPHVGSVVQVWEWDYEADKEMLVIDADPMLLVNDPQLTQIVETLHWNRGWAAGAMGTGKTAKEVLEFIGVIFVKLCEVLFEILS